MADVFALIEAAKTTYVGKKFSGIPDAWFDERYFWCQNGHRSRTILKSEEHGRDVCLECRQPVRTGPEELPGVVPL